MTRFHFSDRRVILRIIFPKENIPDLSISLLLNRLISRGPRLGRHCATPELGNNNREEMKDGNTNTGEWVYPAEGGYQSTMKRIS
jgi:hypothetical protein